MKKKIFFMVFIFAFTILFLAGFANAGLFGSKDVCGDETVSGECSSVKPYYCSSDILIENASGCGCPEDMVAEGSTCVSEYSTGPKEIQLRYVLDGKEGILNYTVYKGMADYVSNIPRSIVYGEGETPLRVDFKLKTLDDPEQEKFLLPLVKEIQNLDSDKENQARIAISIIQNIHFGRANKTVQFGGFELNYSRYPYEVLYDMEGVCGEKSELLAFILRELDYGVVFFYNQEENHESIGIKCPAEHSLKETGYCFVETTGPSVLTNSENKYIGAGKLTSYPTMILISEGDSLDSDLSEYRDAKTSIKINEILEEKGRLNFFRYLQYRRLQNIYGLE